MTDVVVKTLKTNPDVLIEVAKRLAAEEGLGQARGAYLPRLDMAIGGGRQHPTNQTYPGGIDQKRYDRTLSLTQMLFDGFVTPNEVERNQSRLESAAHKLAYTTEQVALKAIESYLEVLRQQEIIRLTNENLVAHLRTYDQIKLRTSSGVGRRSDLDQIEARVALSKANLIAAEANLEVAKINFKLVVGETPGELSRPAAPDRSLLPTEPDVAVQVAFRSNRILNSARADLEAAEAQHRVAKGTLSPRLDLEVGAQKNDFVNPADTVPDHNRFAMLRMRYNLFRGGTDMARIAETRHQAWEAQEVLHRAERQLEQTVRLSWNAYKSATDRLADLRKHAEASYATREAYIKQFSLGQRTLLDLLDTENEYYTAATNHINGQFVELFSRFRVLADAGMLLDTLGIPHREESKLPVR